MENKIFTATGCARCKITKAYMQQQEIDYEELDFKAEGKDAFAKFYRENRNDIYRDQDGVEFPVFSDGSVIRQGVSVIIGYLIAGDALSGFIGRSTLHGEWINGFDISGGDPTHTQDLIKVLAHLKQNGLKIQVFTDGRNAAVLEQLIDKGLADRVIMTVRGPAALYKALCGQSLEEDEMSRSIAAAARCKEYQFSTTLAPLVRDDGTVSYLSPEEIGQSAAIIEAATGSKKHPYMLSRFDPTSTNDPKLKDVEPLEASTLFKYRTAARRFMVMTEIEK
jgi:pyruvate formate lyase activating enzyme